MSTEHLAISLHGECPVCAAGIAPAAGVEETEILTCPDCQSPLVVDGFEGQRIRLSEAPLIEEDWGE
jgi:lysine biosynthesis protein LysW